MLSILVRACCFILIILIGYTLKTKGFFRQDDFHVLSFIVLNITLPCALIVNFTGKEFSPKMLILSVFGLLFSVILMVVAYIINSGKPAEERAFAVHNISAINVGNFVLPFAQSFFSPVAAMCISLIDVGNSFVCMGGSYSIAQIIKDKNAKVSFLAIFKNLFRSIPLDVLLIMVILGLLRIQLPQPIVTFSEICGGANAFLAMFMIGVGFRLSGDKTQTRQILRILIPRYLVAITLSMVCYFILPLPLEYRQALAVVFLGPIASAVPAFTAKLKLDYGLSSAVNSISMVISIVLITAAMMVIL